MFHLRPLYESCTGRDPDTNEVRNRHGRGVFVNSVRHLLGLCDKDGHDYRDPRTNRRTLKLTESSLRAENLSLREMAMACCGNEFQVLFNPDNRASMNGLAAYQQHVAMAYPNDKYALLEAVGAGVDVSAFADINAWTGVASGLLERKILEAFEDPQFIGNELMPVEPTKINEGQKVIGVSRVPRSAQQRQQLRRNPGMPHNRTGVTERYVTLGRARQYADAIDITKEAAFLDLTGQLLPHATSIGNALAMSVEFDIIDAFIGVTSQSGGEYQFKYDGTALNVFSATNQTYSGSSSIGFVNDNTANDLVDFTNVRKSWLGFVRTTDPETGTRVNIMPDTILVNPARLDAAWLIALPGEVERRAAAGATQATAGILPITVGANPVKKYGVGKILWSPLLEQRCTDVDGLNLTQQQADTYWWHFTTGKYGKYMQLEPLKIVTISGTSYDQIDRQVVVTTFCDEWGFPAVWSPWHVQRSHQ